MVTFHPDQADPNYNYSCMTFRDCIKLTLDVDGKDASIDTHRLEKPHILLVHLVALDNGRNSDIGTLKKDRGDIFLECCAESFKEIFLCYVNEIIFEMVKTALNNTYLGGTTPTALQNEVSTFREIYYNRETRIMVNQSLNEFYTRFLFKIYSLSQDVAFPLEDDATFFNNLSPDII